MLERWTRTVLRFRVLVVATWLVVIGAGAYSATRLPGLLSNSFAVPGTDSDRARAILVRAYRESPEGTFTAVFRVRHPSDRSLQERLHRRLVRAAGIVPTGHAGPLRPGGGILYGDIETTLGLKQAKGYTSRVREALRSPRGPPVLVTGEPAVQHDLDPVLESDLRRAEAIAVPVALLILLLVFGFSWAVGIPFAFAASTVTGTLLAVYGLAHAFSMVTWVTNLVGLIGLGLAIDYSLLIVTRFREEISRPWPAAAHAGRSPAQPPPGAAGRHDGRRGRIAHTVRVAPAPPAAPQERESSRAQIDNAVVLTMATAGRAIVASGVAVAAGLALLLFVPVPFIRAMGVAGFLIPLVSIAAALTLQPALLSFLGKRAVAHAYVPRPRFPWERLVRWVIRRRYAVLVGGTALLLAAAAPALFLRLTPGSLSGIPRSLEAARGLELLRTRVGAGAVTPTQIVVDSGGAGRARAKPDRAAASRLADELFRDSEVLLVASGPAAPYVDPSGRYTRVIVVNRHEYGDEPTRRLVERIRHRLVPAAGLPRGVQAHVGGVPAQGVDFLSRSYGDFPWLVAGVLLLTYVILLRAFRSLVLPLKALLLNVLTVGAVYGLLVVAFRWGVTAGLLGLHRTARIDGWVPILLFAVVFGLSMDYEVFLVSRVRESWDRLADNSRAVRHGLERTGRVITAAAAIMAVTFSGFVFGRVPALQEFGLGLVLAVVLDATIVRALLAPTFMAVLDRYNWWLPAPIARLARVAPSPVAKGEEQSRPSPDTITT